MAPLLAAAQIHRPEAERAARGPVIASECAANPALRLFGYLHEGRVLGVAGVEDLGGGHWILRDLAVSADHRQRGVGRELVRFLERELGASTIEGDTLPPATAFYERCGWDVAEADERLPDGRTKHRFRWAKGAAGPTSA